MSLVEGRAYRYLAAIYDAGWNEYSDYIHQLILQIESESGRTFHRICDAACGTGLLLQSLRNDGNGREVVGYDASREMLAIARERIGEATVVPGDLRDPVPHEGEFDMITCVYDSLNYLTEPEEITTFLSAARNAIATDGLLLVDSNSTALYAERRGERHTRLIDGVPLRQYLSFDPGPPPVATTVFSFPEGTEEHRQRPWDPEEIESLLADTGWDLLDSLDAMDEDTDRASGKIVYLAVPAT